LGNFWIKLYLANAFPAAILLSHFLIRIYEKWGPVAKPGFAANNQRKICCEREKSEKHALERSGFNEGPGPPGSFLPEIRIFSVQAQMERSAMFGRLSV
jgi:hypothetical protein